MLKQPKILKLHHTHRTFEMLKQPKILKLHHTHRTLKELKTANSKNQIKTRIAVAAQVAQNVSATFSELFFQVNVFSCTSSDDRVIQTRRKLVN